MRGEGRGRGRRRGERRGRSTPRSSSAIYTASLRERVSVLFGVGGTREIRTKHRCGEVLGGEKYAQNIGGERQATSKIGRRVALPTVVER